jgi:cytochrome c-type biogenesis protein CcmH
MGAAISYVSTPLDVAGSGSTSSSSLPKSGSDDEMLARLEDYTRSIGGEDADSTAATGQLLPDVQTMTDRLAARLQTAPEDIQGWRMLGWSYFTTEHFEQAATAYARALELDPNSAELRLAYEEAKTKASKSGNSARASSVQTGAVGKGGDGLAVEITGKAEATPPDGRDAENRSMVDGLADRLESSPRDLEGWTRLMRSRVVLGEREIAAAAFHNALEVFKDDAAASGKIIAAAIELGLKTE